MKICIMCDQPAGSNEHVFPAALGGRRTNKQIYCTKHNNGFGRHVAVLEEQLSMMNAKLRVRPDRHNAPKPYIFADAQGEKYSILGGRIEFSGAAPFDPGLIGPDGSMTLRVPNMADFERLRISVQKEHGYDLKIAEGTQLDVKTKYFAEPLHVQLTFGGQPALQAIAYLALTFFAQYFPNAARQSSLTPLKTFLLQDFSPEAKPPGIWTPGFVWWDGRDAQDVVGKNPFRFGHTVVVGVSARTGHGYAYISLFSMLNFGINLGSVTPTNEQMVTAHIDPRADRAPNDLITTRSNTFSIVVESSDTALSTLIHSGTAQLAAHRFFEEVSWLEHEEFVEQIKSALTAYDLTDHTNRHTAARSLVDAAGQRILNMIKITSTELCQQLSKDPLPLALVDALKNVVRADPSRENGLSVETSAKLTQAQNAISQAIERELATEAPDAGRIALLLHGNLCMTVVVKNVLLPWMLTLNSGHAH